VSPRSLIVLSFLTIAGACGGDDDGSSTPVDLTIDTFNVGLAGAFVPFEGERRPAVTSALAASTADIVCVQEAWRQADKDAIRAATAARFAHVQSVQHDLDSPVDPIESDCEVPPEPTTPPCAATDQQTKMAAVIACLQENCSTIPGSADGLTTSTACAQEQCIAQAAALLFGTAEDQRCYGCLAPQLPIETFASMADLCTTEVNAGLAFRGQSGVMILSRFPLSGTETTVLPGTWNRRIILKSTATLPNGAEVDVYCNHLSPIFDNVAFPYTGRHGCGMTGRAGWAQEQKLQAEKLIDLVAAEGAMARSIILGDFNASREAEGVAAEAPENLELLAGAFTEAVPAGHVPACTYCPDNPVAGSETAPTWLDHIFVENIPLSAVKSAERVYTERNVATASGSVNLSDHYGMRAVITIEP
jgi:endonuclease/exonuclease/phosphatase family metal-dependent hydrolase